MKKTYRKPCTLLGLTFLMMSSTACLETEMADPDEAGDLAIPEILPFHVGVFDHVPTVDEARADLEQFVRTAYGEGGVSMLVTPAGMILPRPGQKLVQLHVFTSDITNAGTDSATVRFTSIWQAGTGQQFFEVFVLNNPGMNDLERGTLNIFYYLLNVDTHVPGLTQDRFLQGRISNSGTDGWHCSTVTVIEDNHTRDTRVQLLPFMQWVDYPSSTTSSSLIASDNTWLAYY